MRLCLPKNCRYRVTVYFRFLHSNLWCCLVDSRHTLSLLHNDITILVGLRMLNRKKGRHEDMYKLVQLVIVGHSSSWSTCCMWCTRPFDNFLPAHFRFLEDHRGVVLQVVSQKDSWGYVCAAAWLQWRISEVNKLCQKLSRFRNAYWVCQMYHNLSWNIGELPGTNLWGLCLTPAVISYWGASGCLRHSNICLADRVDKSGAGAPCSLFYWNSIIPPLMSIK